MDNRYQYCLDNRYQYCLKHGYEFNVTAAECPLCVQDTVAAGHARDISNIDGINLAAARMLRPSIEAIDLCEDCSSQKCAQRGKPIVRMK